jgi:hypothetical protein
VKGQKNFNKFFKKKKNFSKMSKKGHLILAFIRVLVAIWDFLTYPIYQLIQRPWEKRKAMEKIRSKPIRYETVTLSGSAAHVRLGNLRWWVH